MSSTVTYGGRLRQLAAEHGDGTALVVVRLDGSEEELSWSELDHWSDQAAHLLARRGLGPGDRLAIELPNSFEHVVAAFAGWKLGATVVPVRWDLPDWELGRVRDVLRATVSLTGADRSSIAESRSGADGPMEDTVSEVARGLCSSGSTGTPKVILIEKPGVVDDRPISVTHAIVDSYGPQPHPQRVLVPGPLYHTNGMSALNHLLCGDTVVVMEKFDPERMLDLVERRRIQGFTAATIFLQRLVRVDDIERCDLSSLLWVQQGAAFLPHWLARRWIELVGAERFFMSYGMTEGLGLCAIRGDEWLAHPGSVGRPFGLTELRILDVEGRDSPAGQVGEIYLRTPGRIGYRYLGDDPGVPVLEDGWATVGDLGWLDEDGYLFIADRRADMIVSGGANVFPAEVEAALSEHPAIADVVVIGLSDPEWGRRVHAIVVPGRRPVPVEEVITFAKSRLAPYKVPKTVEFVARLPRSAATKLNRATLIAEREGDVAVASSTGDPARGQGGPVAAVHVED